MLSNSIKNSQVDVNEGNSLVCDNHEFGLVYKISGKLNLRELDGKLWPNYSSFDPKSNQIDQNQFQIGRFRPNKAKLGKNLAKP